MKKFLTLLLFFISLASLAQEKVINFFSYSNYLPESVIEKFEKETGIRVNYSVFDDNSSMYAKLRSNPGIGYDVITPSSYYIQRMVKTGLLQPLDRNKIQNFQYLKAQLINQPFDPDNQYSIPYLWGTTGIAVNKKYIDPSAVKSWNDLWQEKYRNQIMLLNDYREVFSMALLTLNDSINATDPADIKAAYEKLVKILPNVRLFNSTGIQMILADEDVYIGMMWSGDFLQAQKYNDNLVYIFPDDGFSIWIDNLVIPKNAPHLAEAYQFINFITRPEIAAEISQQLGYSTPNEAAMKLMPESLRANEAYNPSAETLKRGHVQEDIKDSETVYEKYWELLLIGGNRY